jgi:hypothetical protein
VQVQGLNFRRLAGLSSHSTGCKYRYIHTSEAVDACFHCKNPPAWMLKFLLYRHLDSSFEEENKSSTAASKQGTEEFGEHKLGETSQYCYSKVLSSSLQTSYICPGVFCTHLNNYQGF